MNRNTFSQTIEQLQNEFATVTENYSYLLERAVTNPEGGKWSPDYVQSIKPYYSEIEEKKLPLNSLYDTPESTGSDSLVLVLANLGQPELIREYYGEGTFYDNLYFRNETETTRYQIYCSSGEVKPILIERLLQDEGGYPECYFVYANGNGQVITYEKEEGSVIARMYTLAGDALNETGRLRIIEEGGSVERIIDMVTNATVYDAGTVDKPLSELLSEYQDLVLKMIEEGLAAAAPDADDIQGMVLEYFPERPFPPSIGLPTLSDKSQWEGESPLYWFNAVESKLFYECEFFHADRTDEMLNTKLQEMEFEDVVQIAEEFYLTLSKRITASEAIRSLVGAGEEFFCTAHDYTAGTDLELLRKYLPEPVFQEIQAEVSSYEQAYEQSVRENEYNLLAEELMSGARSRVEDIIDAHRSGSYERRYGIGARYSINPFNSTRNNGPAKFDIDEQLSRQNLAGIAPYYLAYDLVDGRIVAISSIREDVITGTTYFAYGDAIVEQFDVTPGKNDTAEETLVCYRKLVQIDGVKQECITVSRRNIEIDTYERDESSNNVTVSSLRKFRESNQDPTPVAYLAEYAQDGALRKYTFHAPHDQPTVN